MRRIGLVVIILVLVCNIWSYDRQSISLQSGWNLFSVNVMPESSAIDSIFASEIENGNLLQIKNTEQTMVIETPQFLHTLSEIQAGAGYLVNMENYTSLDVAGEPLDVESTIYNLKAGWNLVGCPYSETIDIETAFAELIDLGYLIRVKNIFESFNPDLPSVYNTLDSIEPGNAYWVNVNSDMEFSFPVQGSRSIRNRQIFPRPWNTVFYPSNTVAYCYVTIDGEQAEEGDEVGAFIDGECRGSGIVFFMDGLATTFFNIQGTSQETVSFNVWDASEDEILEVEYTTMTNPGGDIGFPPNQLPIDATRPPEPEWEPVVYTHSTTVFGRIAINGGSAAEGDTLAAYVDNECRGASQVIIHEGIAYGVILIHGELEESVDFKLLQSSGDYLEFGNVLMSDPGEVLHLPPEYLALNIGEVPFEADLPDSLSFYSGETYLLDTSEYIQYLYPEDLAISISGNANINYEIDGLEVAFSATEGWIGLEEIEFTIENNYTDEFIIENISINVMATGEAEIASIIDVPDDQGGFIEITFNASFYDNGNEVETYKILREFEEEWQYIGEQAFTGEQQYSIIVSTPQDSISTDPAVFNYKIETEVFEESWFSSIMSGYSMDNLAPSIPEGLMISEGKLIWNSCMDEDLFEYKVYIDSESFITTVDTTCSILGSAGVFSVSSRDIHENESALSDTLSGGYLFGDIDGNLIIETMDASLILQYICQAEPEGVPLPWAEWQITLADVDGNGNIDAYDSALILRYFLGMITEFPVNGGNSLRR